MSTIDENFTWYRASSYRLEPVDWVLGHLSTNVRVAEENIQRLRRERDAVLAANRGDPAVQSLNAEIDEAEQNNSYRGVELSQWEYNLQDVEIAALPHWQRYVLVANDSLQEFRLPQANLAEILFKLIDYHAGKPTGVADIAMKFAPLFGPLRNSSEAWIDLSRWREDLNKLNALRARARGASKHEVEIDRVKVLLRPQPTTERPQIVFQPDDLFSLIALQHSLLIAGGAKLSNCLECGRPFFHGGESNRREGALYCDEICREKHKTKRRAEARKAVKSTTVKKKLKR